MSSDCSCGDLALVLLEQPGYFLLVEVAVEQRAVQVERGDELLRPRLFHVVDGLAEDVDHVSPAHGHHVVVVDHGVAVQGHARRHRRWARRRSRPPCARPAARPRRSWRRSSEDGDAAEIGVEDRHALAARLRPSPQQTNTLRYRPAPCPCRSSSTAVLYCRPSAACSRIGQTTYM